MTNGPVWFLGVFGKGILTALLFSNYPEGSTANFSLFLLCVGSIEAQSSDPPPGIQQARHVPSTAGNRANKRISALLELAVKGSRRKRKWTRRARQAWQGEAGGLGHCEQMWPVTPQPTEHMGQGWGHAGFESHSGEGSSP